MHICHTNTFCFDGVGGSWVSQHGVSMLNVQQSVNKIAFSICITRCFFDFHLAALLTLTGSNIVNPCVGVWVGVGGCRGEVFG